MTEVKPLRFRGINKMMHLKMSSLILWPLYSGLMERFECKFRYIIFILISATNASDISWYCPQMNDTGQHWFGSLLAVRQHAINWANVDIDIFRHMASLGHSTETEMLSFWWNFNHWLHRKLTTFGAASDENFVKMTTFLFQWVCSCYRRTIYAIQRFILKRIFKAECFCILILKNHRSFLEPIFFNKASAINHQ